MALTEAHLKILTARGLDPELLVKHGVDASLKFGSDTLAVVIPYYRDGQVVNRKYRSIAGEKKFAQDPNGLKIFWNWDVLTDASLADQPLIITEGEFDALAALQSGYARVVSVPDGAPAIQIENDQSRKYTYLDSAPKILSECREIIIASDGDGPGANLLHDLGLRLGRARCKWIAYPKECKDLNDALMRYGERGVVASIERAKWLDVPGVYRMSELPPLVPLIPYNIGIPGFEEHYRVRLGDLCIVTGIPSMGKTAFVNDVCCRLAQNYKWNCAFASFEQKPQTDHRRALRTWYNHKFVRDQSPEEIHRADTWIESQFTFIVPGEDDDVSLEWVLERASLAAVRHGAKVIVIDPWNEMDHSRPPDMTLTEYTGFAIKQFRKFAAKHGVHMIVVAHPAKQRKNDDGNFSVPSLYDISDSAHWYNKADIGIVVHRDGNGSIIRIAKSRHHEEIGTPGDVQCHYDLTSGRYQALALNGEPL